MSRKKHENFLPSQADLFIDLFNKRGFMFYIFINIPRIKTCPFFFHSAVFGYSLGMASKIIAECSMSTKFFRILRAHIKMMFS